MADSNGVQTPPTAAVDPVAHYSTTQAGKVAATLTGRARPFSANTVRRWATDEGLETDQDALTGRHYIPGQALLAWVRTHLANAPKQQEPTAMATNPRKLRVREIETDLDAEDDEDEVHPDGVLEDECPECGTDLDIGDDAAVVRCPNCGAEFELLDDEDEEDDITARRGRR